MQLNRPYGLTQEVIKKDFNTPMDILIMQRAMCMGVREKLYEKSL